MRFMLCKRNTGSLNLMYLFGNETDMVTTYQLGYNRKVRKHRGIPIAIFSSTTERWSSGWRQRFRKPSYVWTYRGFKSHPLRHLATTYPKKEVYHMIDFLIFSYPHQIIYEHWYHHCLFHHNQMPEAAYNSISMRLSLLRHDLPNKFFL